MLPDIEYLDDIRMLKPCDRLSLAPKPQASLRGQMRSGDDQFQHDESIELAMAGTVDDAGGTAADFLQHFVALDLRFWVAFRSCPLLE